MHKGKHKPAYTGSRPFVQLAAWLLPSHARTEVRSRGISITRRCYTNGHPFPYYLRLLSD